MGGIAISTADVVHHVATFGLDVYPQIEIPAERTRLNMFYEAAHEKWPNLYEQLTAGDAEFKVSKRFRRNPDVAGAGIPVDTFVLTPRGPVLTFPIQLPDPVGATGIEKNYCELFTEVRKAFCGAVPGRTILRVGLVREVVFSTGTTDCSCVVSHQTEWCGTRLTGGNRLIHYRDEKCNVRIELRPCEIRQATQLPIGARVDKRVAYGLQVRLDVNNAEVRPLQDADIDEVVIRAAGFWPNEVVKYLTAEEQ